MRNQFELIVLSNVFDLEVIVLLLLVLTLFITDTLNSKKTQHSTLLIIKV